MTRARLARAATALLLLLVGAEADSASAGSYVVRVCDPAFGADVNLVFSPSTRGAQARADTACAPGRGLYTGIGAPAVSQDGARLQLCAPAGTRITAFRATVETRWSGSGYDRRVDGGKCGGYAHLFGGALPPSPSGYDAQAFARTELNLGGVRLATWCPAICSSGMAGADWDRIAFTIDDYTPPSVTGGRGLWEEAGWVRGTWTTGFDATDPTGIRSMAVRIGAAEKASAAGACQPDGSITRLDPCSSTSMTLSKPIDTTTVHDGRHDLTLSAQDGGRSVATSQAEVRVDNSAPVAVLDRSEDDYGRTVAWDVSDPHSGVDATSLLASLSLDGGATWRPMAGSWDAGRYEATVPDDTPDGPVRVRLSGRDNANPGGNEFTSGESAIDVDRTPPGAPAIGVPDRWLNRGDATHWDATLETPSAPYSGVGGYSVTRDGSEPDTIVDVTGPTWRIDELGDGVTTLKARALSRAGFPGPTGRSVIRVDRELPTAALRGAGNPAVSHPGPVTVTLIGRDRVSGAAQVAYSLDGAAWARVPGDEARIAVDGDGTHRLSYYVVDEAGNASAEESRTVVIARGTDPLRAPGAGFSASATNPRTTFTAARRFGEPCPAETTLTADRAATLVESEPHERVAGIFVGASPRHDALIGFPLPASPDCTVESAVLRMDSPRTIEVRRPTSAWTEPAVTWATRPGTAGPGVAGRGEWDVTALVQGLYDHGDNGLYLRAVDGPVAQTAQAELVVRFSE